eukprot:TRINITY_DN21870_c0_g1_i1.p1 TRINITY_DN21870_c0_g1~~TRINITY_DN21870_c0_g1_i1.p1  ORF type:complete len:232 (+),score=47.60 TRINITY_DN21870_c0_g1_i1:283-978(+)
MTNVMLFVSLLRCLGRVQAAACTSEVAISQESCGVQRDLILVQVEALMLRGPGGNAVHEVVDWLSEKNEGSRRAIDNITVLKEKAERGKSTDRQFVESRLQLLQVGAATHLSSRSAGRARLKAKTAAKAKVASKAQLAAAAQAHAEAKALARVNALATLGSNAANGAYAASGTALVLAVNAIDEVMTWTDTYMNLAAFFFASFLLLIIVIGFSICWSDVERLAVRPTVVKR